MVHLAQRVRQPHRALFRQADAHVREATEEVVQDHARGELHGRAVTPVHHPLERVEAAEGDLGVLAPVGAVLLVVGGAQVHRDPEPGLVDARPDRVEHRIGDRTASERVVAAAVRVPGLELDHRRAAVEQQLELGEREVDVGEGQVRRQEHPTLVGVPDLLVDPAVEGAHVGVERLEVVGELELDVVRARRVHQGLVDALVVHQRESHVAVAVGLALLAELSDQLGALLVAQTLERVQAIEEHPGQRAAGAVGLVGRARRHVAEHLGQLVGGVRDLARVELRRPPGEQLQLATVDVGDVADRQVTVLRVDEPLVQVGRLVEVVVGVVDRVGQVDLGHDAAPRIGGARTARRNGSTSQARRRSWPSSESAKLLQKPARRRASSATS